MEALPSLRRAESGRWAQTGGADILVCLGLMADKNVCPTQHGFSAQSSDARNRGSSCPVLLLVDHGPVRTGRLLLSSGLITYGGNFPGWWGPLVKGCPPGGGVQGRPRALHCTR